MNKLVKVSTVCTCQALTPEVVGYKGAPSFFVVLLLFSFFKLSLRRMYLHS